MKKRVKRGRPPTDNPMVHTAVALPRDMIDRLKSDAIASRHSLSAEIRQQLQLNYLLETDPEDLETRSLLSAIKHLSEFLARDLGTKWHQHPYALAAFKGGLAALLGRYQPEGDERVRPGAMPGDPDDPPDVVGRTHARRIVIPDHEDEGDDCDPVDYRDD